jgi:DNA-directed RNA polymerase specialized sigma24 family protein
VAAGAGRHERGSYLGAERGEALEFATLMLMEKLTPSERAAYVLREAFDYPYAKICDILQSTEPACASWSAGPANT